jgi:hypothetical protein
MVTEVTNRQQFSNCFRDEKRGSLSEGRINIGKGGHRLCCLGFLKGKTGLGFHEFEQTALRSIIVQFNLFRS